MDGAGAKLEEFIQWSTHPDALTRIGNVEDFLSMLDEVEDELTAPDQSAIVDPLLAQRGDRLEQGLHRQECLGPRCDGPSVISHEGRLSEESSFLKWH